MKRIIALLLSAVLLVGVLAGCGGGRKRALGTGLEGKWSTTVDMTDMINQQLAGSGMGEMLQISDFSMVLVMEFKSDNVYTLTLDEDALAESFEGLKGQLKEGLNNYFAQLMPGVDVDQALAQAGMSMDDLLDRSMDLNSLSGTLDLAGQYKIDGDKLYLSNSVTEEPGSNYVTYTLSGDVFTMDTGNTTPDSSLDAMLPFVFQRIG